MGNLKSDTLGLLFSLSLIAVASGSLNAFAMSDGQEAKSIADFGRGLSCKDTQGRTFTLVSSTGGAKARATVDLNEEGRFEVVCEVADEAEVRHPDQTFTDWICQEPRAGEGQVVATVTHGGFAGITQAHLGRLNIIGQPHTLTTMICRY